MPWELGFYDRQGQKITRDQYASAKYATDEYKRVALWGDWGDELVISTVWLGIDHSFMRDGPPIIFETMIFGYGEGNYCTRYATEAQALEGHQRAVDDIENGRMPWFVEPDPEMADNEGGS